MKILKVTPENIDSFNKEMKTPNLIAFVKIYNDNCGHCKDLEPKWEKLENKIKNENANGLLASLSSEHLEDVDCDTDIKGVPTLRVFQGGKRKMDYEGKRETDDMKLFFKNLLKPQKGGKRKSIKGGRRKYRKKRTGKKKKKKKKRKKNKRGGFCLTKKCKKEKQEKQEKKEQKKNIQIHKDFENERYKLAWEVCDMNDKNEYDKCVNNIVGKKTKSVDELIEDINISNVNIDKSIHTEIKPPAGMRRRNTPPGLSKFRDTQMGGRRRRRTQKKRSHKSKSRKRRRTRKKRKKSRRKR